MKVFSGAYQNLGASISVYQQSLLLISFVLDFTSALYFLFLLCCILNISQQSTFKCFEVFQRNFIIYVYFNLCLRSMLVGLLLLLPEGIL